MIEYVAGWGWIDVSTDAQKDSFYKNIPEALLDAEIVTDSTMEQFVIQRDSPRISPKDVSVGAWFVCQSDNSN